MREMTVTEVLGLVRRKPGSAISIYIGTNVKESDGPQRIRSNLKRLMNKVESLVKKTHDFRSREKILKSLHLALSKLSLKRAKGGIAIYHSEDFTGLVKLPTDVTDLAVVADSFHLKPVLKCAQLRRNFFLLHIQKQRARLVSVTQDGFNVLDTIELNLNSSREEKPENEEGRHQVTKLYRHKDARDSMKLLEKRISSFLKKERRPLLLAGNPYLQTHFRSVCSYAHLNDIGIQAAEVGEIEDQVRLASNLMEEHFAALDASAIVSFYRAHVTGLALYDLKAIAVATAHGQIEKLLIAEDQHVWGCLDRNSGDLKILSEQGVIGADDLLDDLAELTILKGGNVTVLPSAKMPDNQAIAAILRWKNHSENGELSLFNMTQVPDRYSRLELGA